MTRVVRAVAAIAFIALLFGCARYSTNHSEAISVSTNPQDASCTLANQRGEWSVSYTPSATVVERSNSPLKVACHKKGYQTAFLSVSVHRDNVYAHPFNNKSNLYPDTVKVNLKPLRA